MKNNISKFMMIAAAAVALFAAVQSKAAPGGGTTTTGPTPVEEQAAPAKTAVAAAYNCSNGSCTTTFAVPIGMRLVVENITGLLAVSTPTTTAPMLYYTLDGTTKIHFLIASAVVFDSATSRYLQYFHMPTKFYADGIGAIMTGPLPIGSPMTVIGYLVKK